METGYTVRTATPADVPAILDLWDEMMQLHAGLDARFLLKPDGRESFGAALHEWLVAEHIVILVADAGSELIGFGIGLDRENPPVFLPERSGYVTDMAVTASWRRGGVGRALYAGLVQWFQSRGLSTVRLSVAHHNPVSQAFWRAMGLTDYLDQMWGDVT